MEANVNTSTGERGPGEVLLVKQAPLATIRLGDPSEKVVTLTERRMNSLIAAVESIAKDPNIQGVVIVGCHEDASCLKRICGKYPSTRRQGTSFFPWLKH